MGDLGAALTSGDLAVLLYTAVALGFLHTILGPDHYVPFVMMAKAQNWSRPRAAVITFLCGLGHVGSSVAIGLGAAAAGMVFAEWEGSRWAAFHEIRGSFAAWLLIGVGVAFAVWGVVRIRRGRGHTHGHLHEDGSTHVHEHAHKEEHSHVHESAARRLTPWVLFTIFVFGPCESVIPLMLAAWSVAGLRGSLAVAGAFSVVTIVTIMVTVGALLMGLGRLPLGKLERWSTTLAGVSLIACGAAIQWLGL